MKRFATILACCLCLASLPAQAEEIGYIEDFALAPDRTVPLKQLIPGTEDYYYYHSLHYQNTGQHDKVAELLANWIKRYGHTQRVQEIRYRQALLTYKQSPQQSLTFIRQELNLQFNHQRQELDRKPNLPTRLDQASIGRDAYTDRAMRRHKNLQGFEDTALDWLVAKELDPDRLRHLLERLQRPDYPNLPELIVADLNHPQTRPFGGYTIHQQLLQPQLEELLKLKPSLLNEANFVNIYLTKLHPNDDLDWRHEPAAKRAYLDRLWEFVSRLAPAHNSLKAHVLYHRLEFDRSQGVYDKQRFLTYLQLPRQVPYILPRFLEQGENRRFAADLKVDFQPHTLLPPVVNDEPLVRSYLEHFFVEMDSYEPFADYVIDTYLRRIFAITKIVQGLGDPERWYSMLTPAEYQQLKDRIDLDFAHTNTEIFDADEPVSLDLHVKNVEKLIVKVYEINTRNFYRDKLREIDTDITLEGLVPNEEQVHTYAEPPLRRVHRHFEFPTLTKPGVYVIDFIGNGKSSRALIRKGKLRFITRTSTAGHVFTVLNDRSEVVPNAMIYFGGHEYKADAQGRATIPFSTQPGREPVVLYDGQLASLDHFQHEAENYSFTAGIHVDREQLIRGQSARVLIRPGLYMNGIPVTLSVLEEIKLTITTVDIDGVSSTKEVGDFKLQEDGESTYEFKVPPRLSKIAFLLRAKVKSLTRSEKVDLQASAAFTLNQIDTTEKTQDLFLTVIEDQHVLGLLGKSGEILADRAVHLIIKHEDFRDPHHVSLQTDEQGNVWLGPLDGIASLTASDQHGVSHTWHLRDDRHTYYDAVHGRAGDVLELPYMGTRNEPARDELSLLELRGDRFVADRFQALSLDGGILRLGELPRGDYDLLFKHSGQRIRLRLTTGEKLDDFILGPFRQLQVRDSRPLQLDPIQIEDNQVTLRVRNANPFTRVHVFATRFFPAYDSFANLSVVRDAEPSLYAVPKQPSYYLEGRNIGDEIRYILDRKYETKFPGNMLERPELLLNPWAIRQTETTLQMPAAGDDFARAKEPPGRTGQPGAAAAGEGGDRSHFSNLDFLGLDSAVLLNLEPDEQGLVTIARDVLGPHQHLHVVAIAPQHTVYRTISLAAGELPYQDLRLAEALDPETHYTQQKQISVVKPEEPFVLADITSSRFEIYDSLARVYSLYSTLSGDPHLVEFRFVLDWPNLAVEDKRDKYSEYASHELNFFLAHKDPEFFERDILPYLENKKDKTFLDHYLLGEDLSQYLLPWQFQRLNVAERALLGRRLEQRPAIVRHVQELHDLVPPDIERRNFLFETALKGSSLDTDDRLGLLGAVGKAQAEKQSLRESMKADDKDMLARNRFGEGGGMAAPPSAPAEQAAPQSAARPAADKSPAQSREMAQRGRQLQEARKETESAKRRAADPADRDGTALFYQADEARRADVRQLYRQLDKTKEWVENNYYHLPIEKQDGDLITVNAFWNDFAAHPPDQPFYSTNLAEASGNFPEMLLALAVLDLPFQPEEHETQFDNTTMTLEPGSPAIVFHEEIKPAEHLALQTPILVSQNFFRLDDRYMYVNAEKQDKYVTDEFLTHVVYGCQVVVTNPTSTPRKLDLLLQVPEGAIPVKGSKYTRNLHVDLQPFNTKTVEYHFYFPTAGEFPHYPVHVAQNEELLAFSEAASFQVVQRPTRIDRESWEYISQFGTDQQVLDFLQKNNLQRLELDKIAFRMRDKAFFQKVVNLLGSQHAYNHTLWSYAIYHDLPNVIQQFLRHADSFVQQAGWYIDSPLLVIDPVERRLYQHMEYKPLVNARQHQLGKRRQIVNDRFHQQYHRLLKVLSYHAELSDEQRMATVYYMVLQDRVADAFEHFGRVNPENLNEHLQYDYFTAYLAFYRADPQMARDIAEKYADYPVDRWREAFLAIIAQVDEIEGAAVEIIDDDNLTQKQTKLAATEPSFDFQVEAQRVRINYQNLTEVRVNYYLMDIEMLFSRNPFVQQYASQFAYIRPNQTQTVALPGNRTSFEFPLPPELRNQNVLVEITAAGQTKAETYYSNSLAVQVVENYGQVRVAHADTKQPLPKVYVKVYARLRDGSVRFYKDGYTDLRGRFDFTALSTNELDNVDRFSLLVLSEEHGAVVREAQPPKR